MIYLSEVLINLGAVANIGVFVCIWLGFFLGWALLMMADAEKIAFVRWMLKWLFAVFAVCLVLDILIPGPKALRSMVNPQIQCIEQVQVSER